MDPKAKSPLQNHYAGIMSGLGAGTTDDGVKQLGLLGLGTLFSRPEARGLYYNGKEIVLDGYTFVGCRFDNCRLRVSSLNFDLIDCVVDASTQVEYGPEIVKPLRLFVGRYAWADQVIPAFFRPKRNPDGTITISMGAGR